MNCQSGLAQQTALTPTTSLRPPPSPFYSVMNQSGAEEKKGGISKYRWEWHLLEFGEVEEASNNAAPPPPTPPAALPPPSRRVSPLADAMLPEGPKKTHDDSHAQKKMVTRHDA